MQLHPKRHPGRTDRKAAAYAAEIGQLRNAGYTYEAIREALVDVGIAVSTSTLRREVRRLQRRSNVASSGPLPASRTSVHAASLSSAPPPRPTRPAGSSGREVAEAFFSTHPSNSLLRTQEVP